jgi:hypothetical protein
VSRALALLPEAGEPLEERIARVQECVLAVEHGRVSAVASAMSDVPPLHQLVTVNARFARSVSLVRDFESTGAIDGYILTPIGRDVLTRIQLALRGDSATRAWSLTGP